MLAPLLLVLLASACGDDGDRDRPTPAAPATAPAPTTPAPAPAAGPIAPDVLDGYEAIRAALAADQLEPVWDAAARLERAAASAADSAPEPRAAHYGALAVAAARLRESPRDDALETRRAYGEVSRHLVALVHAEPQLGRGLMVYLCPMATGYPKWVQRDDGGPISNPYMGTRMPSCGHQSEWGP